MSSGEDFRRELRKALADLHKAQRNKRGKRPGKRGSAQFGTLGYRRDPPTKPSSGAMP
jgi:hypothetical protein